MKKLLMLAAGGTIASRRTSQGLAPDMPPEELLAMIPEYQEFCQVDTRQVLHMDSTNLQPEHWTMLVEQVEASYEEYDGFLITHGTDTMAYTAAALSYMIQKPDKPVVITGAQKPIESALTDGKKNLLDSLRFLCAEGSCGVFLVFGGKAILGTRARKVRSKSFGAFESINYPEAAFIDDARIVRYTEHCPDAGGSVRFYHEMNPRIFLLKLIPGMEPEVLDYVAVHYDGIILESYGVGGIPFYDERNFLEKLADVTRQGKLVVIATQVLHEGSDAGLYEVGHRALSGYHVLQAYDMTVEAAVTKLMWLTAQTKDFTAVRDGFYTKIHQDILIRE